MWASNTSGKNNTTLISFEVIQSLTTESLSVEFVWYTKWGQTFKESFFQLFCHLKEMQALSIPYSIVLRWSLSLFYV